MAIVDVDIAIYSPFEGKERGKGRGGEGYELGTGGERGGKCREGPQAKVDRSSVLFHGTRREHLDAVKLETA